MAGLQVASGEIDKGGCKRDSILESMDIIIAYFIYEHFKKSSTPYHSADHILQSQFTLFLILILLIMLIYLR